jgi:Do/DeqQ family serine protease
MKKWLVRAVLFSATAFVFGISGAAFFYKFYKPQINYTFSDPPAAYASFNRYAGMVPSGFNFVEAANKSRPAVVFVQSTSQGSNQDMYGWDMFFNFFANPGPVVQSGSGVIVSSDGYIITNNHVVKDADKLEVQVLNHKKSYPAKVVGTDPSSDLALLKIEARNLPYIEFTNSDSLQVGDWVVAVGNPFNLTSTVTSGIVSAKGRNINIVKNNFPIESFIQTDAAINPGNSGGALVDISGRLVGINTAILSQTGSYAGLGFAIPSNIVKKIIDDLKQYGIVQRAFIEAEVIDIDDQLATKIGKEDIQGVYVKKVYENSDAAKSGLTVGDIIIKANSVNVFSRSVFDEQLAYLRPGDKLNLQIIRDDKIININLKATNSEGNPEFGKDNTVISEKLGASFTNITKREKEFYGIDYGIKITNLKKGVMAQLGLSDGFIIMLVNSQKFESAAKLVETLESIHGWLMIKGITPEGWIVTRSINIY